MPCFESSQRAEIVLAELIARGHEICQPDQDSSDMLAKIHSSRYLNFLQTAWQQWLDADAGNAEVQPYPSVWPVRSLRDDIEPDDFVAKLGLYSMDNGTPMTAGTWPVAKACADAAVSAAQRVSNGQRSVFCATRPPGHHAGFDFMGGYCFLNNAAVAAQSLIDNGSERVAILDVDYHHGNGTQSIFYERSDVLVVNIHGDPKTEFPFYLGHADEHGAGDGSGFNLNLPLPSGATVSQWFAALEVALERVSSFKPDSLVVSLGLDTFINDPISKFTLQSTDFLEIGNRIEKLKQPTVWVLEGGYAVNELGENTANVLSGFEQSCQQ